LSANPERGSDRAVFIVDGCRTPFIKARGRPGPFAAIDLALGAGRPLLLRQPYAVSEIDEVILGCAAPGPDEANIARVAALRLKLPDTTPAFTVQRNCGSGLQAIESAWRNIRAGAVDLVLAGGTESLSHAPLLVSDRMVNWLADWRGAKRLKQSLGLIARLRPSFFVPVIGLARGLTDPLSGLNMGQTAEVLADDFKISRVAMDSYALESHRRLAKAQDEGGLAEIEPLYGSDGRVYESDDGLRRDTGLDQLAHLRPIFEPPYGKVTAGNSAQVTDGAALLLLASQRAIDRLKLTPLARIVDIHWAALDPARMGLGPVHATTPLMIRHGLRAENIDAWELNEAFAAQVLACLAAWRDERYCRERLGLQPAFGDIPADRLNVDGGAIALGHPVGASGARIALHLVHVLRRKQLKLGIATLCIGGGQGGAMLLERS
jgi:acetyl-CoA C-acetyltransferase